MHAHTRTFSVRKDSRKNARELCAIRIQTVDQSYVCTKVPTHVDVCVRARVCVFWCEYAYAVPVAYGASLALHHRAKLRLGSAPLQNEDASVSAHLQ